jgi:hypothetical protein
MTDLHTVDELEDALRGDERDWLSPQRLSGIRAAGVRRRRGRRALAAGGTAAVAAAVLVIGVVVVGAGTRGATEVATYPAPERMSELAERALAEVPGAVRVSGSQVTIPRPVDARPRSHPGWTVAPEAVVAAALPLDGHGYSGVTDFRGGSFPGWLAAGASSYARAHGGDAYGTGVLVDEGDWYLGCVRPDASPGTPSDRACDVTMLLQSGDGWVGRVGLGTDEFLRPGADLELFTFEDFSTGTRRTLWVGGRAGTDVGRVDLATADGTTVRARVANGTVVPGASVFWAAVDGDAAGEVTEAVVRDGSGAVVEEHPVEPCSGGVDCEVR